MAEQQQTVNAKPWNNLKEEMVQRRRKLNESLTHSMRLMSDDLSKMFDDLKDSNLFLEASFNEAKQEASGAKHQVCDLEVKISEQSIIIEKHEKNCKFRIIL